MLIHETRLKDFPLIGKSYNSSNKMIRAQRTTNPISSQMDILTRGHLINLKKILFPKILAELKTITPTILKKEAWVALGGIDAVNFHFSGKYVHNSLIEVVISPFSPNDTTFDLDELILALLNACNEATVQYGNLPMMLEILKDATKEANKTGVYFEKGANSIVYRSSLMPTFIEFRVIPGLYVVDRYGVKYLTLPDIAKYPSNFDAENRNRMLDQALKRDNLTFTNSCMKNLIKICFPAVHMRKVESVEEVEKTLNFFLERCDDSLKSAMHRELRDFKDDQLVKGITMQEFGHRCVKLGLLPANIHINNEFNGNVLYETKTELVG